MSNDCTLAAPDRPLSDDLAAAWSRRFKALADPTRVNLVAMLAGAPGSLCVCELEAAFDLSQPTISHHLKLLREAGIVSSSRRGSNVHYTLDADALRELVSFSRMLGCC